ncbi:MAG: methylated-DNA--[protein]-cysteine S-methyltransferase [Deltaproteobacteria bacterium]|nr:methylated-DNA--[protein]-cysteine S-methyltransferase [Deltaproteobacteria bacterium]
MEFVSLFETELGIGAVVASERGIRSVVLPGCDEVCPGGQPAAPLGVPSPLTERVARMLESYFKGERQDFEAIPVDLDELTAFRARILLLIRAIPFGEVRSYGEVAALAGAPRAVRAVGGAMASNPAPIVIPCHRVVAANGGLTGFTAPGGLPVKKLLLHMEGVEFKGERVRLKNEVYKQEKLA